MGPDADEPLHRQRLEGPQGLEDAPNPAGHLSGRVDVVRLGILGETLLNEKDIEIRNVKKLRIVHTKGLRSD